MIKFLYKLLFNRPVGNCPICNKKIFSKRKFRPSYYEMDCYDCSVFITLNKVKKFKQLIYYTKDYALKIQSNGSLNRLETDGMFWFKTFEIISEESESIDSDKAIKILKKYIENSIFQ